MRAKEVVAKMNAVPANISDEEKFDKQAAVFVDCAWEEFKRITLARFPSHRASPRSILSLLQEFTNWGVAVQRIGAFSWMRPTAGSTVFRGILGALGGKDVSEGLIALDRAARPEINPNILRQGL